MTTQIKKIFFILIIGHYGLCSQTFIFASNNNKEKEDKSKNHILDSLINNVKFGQSKLIYSYLNNTSVDSLQIDKIHYQKKDSSILIKFSNNFEKKISRNDVLLQITSYGERKRFYNGNQYTIWHTKSPYVYRILFHDCLRYYFSESLTSEISIFNAENIKCVKDTTMNLFLKNYMIENDVLKFNNEKYRDLKYFSMNTLAALLYIPFFVLDVYTGNATGRHNNYSGLIRESKTQNKSEQKKK